MPNYAPQTQPTTQPSISCLPPLSMSSNDDGKYVFLTSLVVLSALVIVIFAIYAMRR